MRASAEYDMSESSMMYISFSQGFKSGGANNGDCNPHYNPENLDAAEIGFKASLADGATTLRGAFFHYDYEDFQIIQVKNFAGVITNADEAEITGMELELTSAVSDRWLVNAGLTILESEYGEFLQEDLSVFNGVPVQIGGNPLNNAPETSMNLGVTYGLELGSGAKLALSLDTA